MNNQGNTYSESKSGASRGFLRVFLAGTIVALSACLPSASLTSVARQPGRSTSSALTATQTVTAQPSARPTAAPSATATVPAPSPTPTLPPESPQPAALGPAPPAIRAKIQIVWPAQGAAVRDAELANVTVYLIDGERASPPCEWDPVVRLWVARNSEPARPLAAGVKRMLNASEGSFPVWDFYGVDISAARDSSQRLAFFVEVEGFATFHNVWIHAADARTIFPHPDVPIGATLVRPDAVDARIEVVWPRDGQSLEQAATVNATVYLFVAGTRQALASGISWQPTVRLHLSRNSEAELPDTSYVGMPRVMTENDISFLAWDFNDVDVRSTQDSMNRIHFWISTDDVPTYSNIWVHGLDARTYAPEAEILSACGTRWGQR